MNSQSKIPVVDFTEQVNLDQKRYSRYVCDSRAIPHLIDGLKPVQRRILWTMWNSTAKNQFTKTVKIAGMTMAYHPHGDASINDAIAVMTQDFTFANNYPFIKGEGTFGDILDPKAIASPRYTEVKISSFAMDVGFFDSLEDITYVASYDEKDKEPIFFCPKIPTILLNPTMGIATGFRCNILAHHLKDVCDGVIAHLNKKEIKKISPWYRNFKGSKKLTKNKNNSNVFVTGFGFTQTKENYFLIAAPQNWNREKTINYIENVVKENNEIFREYIDHSKDSYQIELVLRRGKEITTAKIKQLFDKTNMEVIDQNVISAEGRLKNYSNQEIIANFCDYRKQFLVKRFLRLAEIEKEKISRYNELIRFINEKWNEKVLKLKNKKDFEEQLKKNQYKFYEWLTTIPVYRMTVEEIKKSKENIKSAKEKLASYEDLATKEKSLIKFMVTEIEGLKEKYS